MDTKKKETLGNFYREGVTDAIEPTIVNDHDFPSQGNGKVIPHEIYDLGKNKAVVYLACKGVPLESIETAKHYMEKMKRRRG